MLYDNRTFLEERMHVGSATTRHGISLEKLLKERRARLAAETRERRRQEFQYSLSRVRLSASWVKEFVAITLTRAAQLLRKSHG